MTLRIIEAGYAGQYRYDWILNNILQDKVFFKAANKNICLLGVTMIPHIVIMFEENKVPLWKQAMNMQMGIRNDVSVSLRQYKTYNLAKLYMYNYEIYRVN